MNVGGHTDEIMIGKIDLPNKRENNTNNKDNSEALQTVKIIMERK